MSNLDAPASPDLRDLPGFVADIHFMSAELCTQLQHGIVPSTQDWMAFVDMFCAAQLLWWHRQRQSTNGEGPPSTRHDHPA